MDHLAHMVGEKVGGVVEGAIKSAMGGKDKSGDKKKGGGFSLFGGNKTKDQGGGDEGKGGFISNLLDKGDNNTGGGKKSGFGGLFAEQEGAGSAGAGAAGAAGAGGGSDGGVCEYTPPAENAGAGGGELYDDLFDVASEMSGGQEDGRNLQPHPASEN